MADIKIEKHLLSEVTSSFLEKILLNDNRAETLKSFCLNGEVSQNYVRPTAWKMFLNVFHRNSSPIEWVEIIAKNRAEYKKKIKTYCAIKKLSGDPLGGSSTSKQKKKDANWETFYQETDTKNLINLDLSRTYQEIDVFLTTTTKNTLANVLFIWSKENADVSYQQGMNENLAVFYLALYPFYFRSTKKPKPTKDTIISYLSSAEAMDENIDDIYIYFHDEEEIQADLYFIFSNFLAKGIKDLFNRNQMAKGSEMYKKYELFPDFWKDNSDEDVLTVVNRRSSLVVKEKMKILDEELFSHFKKIDLDCKVFLQRWLRCAFNREFEFKDVFILWDAIFANESQNERYPLIFMDYICIAMIFRLRKDLLLSDQNECFTSLFHYDKVENIFELVELAEKIKIAIEDRLNGKNASVYDILLIPRPMMGSAYSVPPSDFNKISNKYSNDEQQNQNANSQGYNPIEYNNENAQEAEGVGSYFLNNAISSLGNFGGFIKGIGNQVKEKVTEKIDQLKDNNIFNAFANDHENQEYQQQDYNNQEQYNNNYQEQYNNNYQEQYNDVNNDNNNNYNQVNEYNNYNNNNQQEEEQQQPIYNSAKSGISDPKIIAPKLEEILTKYKMYMDPKDKEALKNIIQFINDNI